MPDLLEKLLRIAEVEAATGLDRSTIYRHIGNGFPEPIQLSPGGRAVAWKQSEVSAWIEERATKGREAWRANRPKARAMAQARRAGERGRRDEPHDPEQNPSLDEIESVAAVAAGFWLKEAAEALDETFGPGYAEKHAPAVAGFLAACATYYRAERSVDAAETVRRALAGVETAIRDAGRGPRATP